jgi:hypothetical protein
MMTMCAAVSVGGTIFLVYEFSFAVRPHQIVFACILAAAYMAVSGAGLWLLGLRWLRRARKA